MQSNFSHQWSTALGLNISALNADQEGVQRISQAMADFLQTRNANSVMDKINSELNLLRQYGENIRLKMDYGNGMVVNDETKQLADSFLLEAKDAVQGKWPEAWGDSFKEPLMLFVAYATASNAISNKKNIDWAKTLPILTSTYVKKKGPEKLHEHMNSIDQFLPQVLIGAATALLPLDALSTFNDKIKEFSAAQKPGARPLPVEFLNVLLEVRNSHPAADTPAQAQP